MNHGERRRLFPQIDKRLATGRIARTLRRSHRIGDLTPELVADRRSESVQLIARALEGLAPR